MRIFVHFLLFLGSLPCTSFAKSTESIFLDIENKYATIEATLHLPKQPTEIAVVHAHTWSNLLAAFPAVGLAEKRYAVLSLDVRGANKAEGQPDEIFEMFLLDVAAGVQEMKDRGYEKIILLGGSSGGPLMACYQNVAENGNAAFAGERKVYKFPGFFEQDGRPMRLPKADGLIFRNPLNGTSDSFLNRLDPSILDEATGKKDPALDMFNPLKGFNPKTGLASYSKEFIRQYWSAQAARMNRLIDSAQRRLDTIRHGKGPFTDDDLMIIRGTRARLFYTDMSLGHGAVPNLILPENTTAIPKHDRAPGHYALLGRVQERNASVRGAVVYTLRSFLSIRAVRATPDYNPLASTLKEWGVDVESTNNSTVGNMMHVDAPWVLFAGTADDKITCAELIYSAARAKDKKIIVLRGATHGITSVDPARFLNTDALRELMVGEISKWIDQRFR